MHESGFSPTCIKKLCEEYNIPIHIKWGENKIDSFTPQNNILDDLCIIIWGNHLYTVSDQTVCNQIKKENISTTKQEPFILDRIIKNNSKAIDFSNGNYFLNYCLDIGIQETLIKSEVNYMNSISHQQFIRVE